MPPTVRSTGSGNSGSTTSLTFTPTMPVGFVAGDLLIGIAGNGGGAVPSARPSGSTLIQNVDDGTVFNLDIVRKIAVGGDTFTWTVTTTARKWAGAVVAITRGTFDAANPVQGNVGAAKGTTSTTTFVTPSSTPASYDQLVIAAFGAQVAATWQCNDTDPTMVELADTTSTGTTPASVGVYRSSTPHNTTAFTRTGTASVSSANGAAFKIFVNPAPTTRRRPRPSFRR